MTGVTDSSVSLSHSIQARQHRPVIQHINQTAVMVAIHVCWSECGGISVFIFMFTPVCVPPAPHWELRESHKQRELLGVQCAQNKTWGEDWNWWKSALCFHHSLCGWRRFCHFSLASATDFCSVEESAACVVARAVKGWCYFPAIMKHLCISFTIMHCMFLLNVLVY